MKKTLILSLISFIGFNLVQGQENEQINFKKYSMSDSVPVVIYKELKEKEVPKISFQGKKYLKDGMMTIKAEYVKTFDLGTAELTLKDGYSPDFISLSEFKRKYTNVKSDHVIYKIEDKIIQDDPDELMVDQSNIMLISVSPIKFIGDLNDLYMITLRTRTEKNIKELNTVRIR